MGQRVAVIGGGAAGLCCAVVLARGGAQVCVLEALDRVGKKLALTGNGQCNIGHRNAGVSDYHGTHRTFCQTALERFGFEKTEAFFATLGVPFCVEESGKAYPASYQATSVVDALRFEAQLLGVDVRLSCPVTGLTQNGASWHLRTPAGTVVCDCVVLATGGLAGGAKVGSTGDGFTLLKSLGYAVTPLTPSVVQLKSNAGICRSLKGIKVDALASLEIDGRQVRREYGEVLFTDYGLSGPAVMQLSREVSARPGEKTVFLDLFPHTDEAQLTAAFLTRRDQLAKRQGSTYFTGLLQNRLGFTLLKEWQLHGCPTVADFSDEACRNLARYCKNLPFPVTGSTGMVHAQVTAGGLDTAAFDGTTMESRRHPGLFAVGEVLDVDGDCGGYNLQWAWSSASLCAMSILEKGRRP